MNLKKVDLVVLFNGKKYSYTMTSNNYKKIIEANKDKYKNLKYNTIIKPDWKLNIP